jgi:hypothetical protein
MALVPKERNFARIDAGPWLAPKKQLFSGIAIPSRVPTRQLAAFSDLVLLKAFSSLVGLAELMRDLTQPSPRASILT